MIYATLQIFLIFFIFADDTNLLHADNNLKNLQKTFNKELAKVSSWLIANKLTLNIRKSNFVIFRPYQKKIRYQSTIKLFDNNSQRLVALECKTYVKYLTVLRAILQESEAKLEMKNFKPPSIFVWR